MKAVLLADDSIICTECWNEYSEWDRAIMDWGETNVSPHDTCDECGATFGGWDEL